MIDKAFIGAVEQTVACVPYGQVATYGQIARLVGYPGHARHVGKALSSLSERSTAPWHRIVNAKGEVSLRSQWSVNAGSEVTQRILLEEEGVEFSARGKIDLQLYMWRCY